jgi:aerotolerance regulator-like protein
MVWLHPTVLIGLIALGVPIAIHLLRRRAVRPMVVPTIRFIQASNRSAVRLLRISDPLLLLIRAGIIASAVLALARPLGLTNARIAAWGGRTARAVIVDSSESARRSANGDVVAAELATATPGRSLETADLALGIQRAAAWLEGAPPVRREIVIVSDFQRGALDESSLAEVPKGIGIRFLRTKDRLEPSPIKGIAVLDREASFTALPAVDGSATRVEYSKRSDQSSGLRIFASSGEAAISSLWRIVATAGAYAPDSAQPMMIQFDAAASTLAVDVSGGDWTFETAQRLLRATSDLRIPIRVSRARGSLVVRAQVDAKSLAAARVVQEALDARVPIEHFQESEPERIEEATLARWTREPAPPDLTQWPRTDESDGRWMWTAALLFIGLESYLRRRPGRAHREVIDHAA